MDNDMLFDMIMVSIGIITGITGLYLYWRDARRGN